MCIGDWLRGSIYPVGSSIVTRATHPRRGRVTRDGRCRLMRRHRGTACCSVPSPHLPSRVIPCVSPTCCTRQPFGLGHWAQLSSTLPCVPCHRALYAALRVADGGGVLWYRGSGEVKTQILRWVDFDRFLKHLAHGHSTCNLTFWFGWTGIVDVGFIGAD